MAPINRLSAGERSNLVAFLDDELDEDQSNRIDEVLAESPVARHEVEMLTRTWEMLDLLPRPAADAEFTERTLATIKMQEIQQPVTDRPWFRQFRRGAVLLGWLTAMVVSAALGFFLTNRWLPHETHRLVENLPVIENLDKYSEIDNVQFLRELQRSGLFDDRKQENLQP